MNRRNLLADGIHDGHEYFRNLRLNVTRNYSAAAVVARRIVDWRRLAIGRNVLVGHHAPAFPALPGASRCLFHMLA